MPQIIPITSASDPRVAAYTALTERQLQNRLDPRRGLFVAESPKVILTALSAGYLPESLLCEERHLRLDAAPIVERLGADTPIYIGTREVLAGLTGYTLTRGVLSVMRRPELPSLEEVVRGARRVVVLDAVVDATNVGALFRSAAALGADAVVCTPQTCDPLNRRAIRVSMGSVFLVPWTWAAPAPDGRTPLDQLHALGFETCAMALRRDSITLSELAARNVERLAIVLGGEGWGLDPQTIDRATHTVMIPMRHGVDSLNVAAAGAVAIYALMQ